MNPLIRIASVVVACALGASTVPTESLAAQATDQGVSPQRKIDPQRSRVAIQPAGASRCTEPSGDPIPAIRILQDLKEGRSVDIEGRIIDGSLDAESVWPSATEDISSLRVVPGRLRIASSRVLGGVIFPQFVFSGGLDLTCTEVRGEIDLSDSHVLDGLSAARLRTVGDLRMKGLSVGGPLDLEDSSIGRGIYLQGSRVYGTFGLDSATVGGSVEISGAVFESIEMDDAEVTGAVTFDDVLVLGDFTAADTVVAGGVLLNTSRIAGGADFDSADTAGGLALTAVSVEGDLIIALATEGRMDISGLLVGGDLSLWDGQFGAVTLQRARVAGETDFDEALFGERVVITDCDFGSDFTADEARFLGEVEFRSVRFPGDDPMDGALFVRSPTLIDTDIPATFEMIEDEDENEDEDEYGGED